jgi:hypothetical protein
LSCRDRLINDLLNLPTLYSDCGTGTRQNLVRVIRKVPRKAAGTDSMNPAAAEIRSSICTVLASWAGLVADERRLEPPIREVRTLAHFLVRHAEWLSRHPAAGELVNEIRDLTRTANDIAYPGSVRRVRVGYCPDSECGGELVARIRPHRDFSSEIACTMSSGHTWPITWWTKLARRMQNSQGERA